MVNQIDSLKSTSELYFNKEVTLLQDGVAVKK